MRYHCGENASRKRCNLLTCCSPLWRWLTGRSLCCTSIRPDSPPVEFHSHSRPRLGRVRSRSSFSQFPGWALCKCCASKCRPLFPVGLSHFATAHRGYGRQVCCTREVACRRQRRYRCQWSHWGECLRPGIKKSFAERLPKSQGKTWCCHSLSLLTHPLIIKSLKEKKQKSRRLVRILAMWCFQLHHDQNMNINRVNVWRSVSSTLHSYRCRGSKYYARY